MGEHVDSEPADDEDEIIPELDDGFIRDPFTGVDTDDPHEVADAVGEINPQAGMTVYQLIEKTDTLSQQVDALERDLNDAKKEQERTAHRHQKEREQIQQDAVGGLVESLIPVRESLIRALESNGENTNELREGIQLVKQELDEVLHDHGVRFIEPATGDSISADKHQVMATVESTEVSEGRIVECYRVGYRLSDHVIAPAEVSVASSDE